jgi:sodium/hydrogen antiporter
MEHGLDTEALAVIAACVIFWGVVSARFERANVTAPVAFVALGLIAANGPLSLIDIDVQSGDLRSIAEVTLALVLFADASRVNVRALRSDPAIPTRLLAIGLPLTIGLGTLIALVTFGGIDPWIAAVIAAAVAPTDAALGASIMEDLRVPGRIRRVLNVESGLNDGIATPFVTFFVAGAAESTAHGETTLRSALVDLGIGVVAGVVVGLLGGLLLAFAERHGWGARAFRPVAVAALALLAYAGTIEVSGNGFVAAFVAGMAFGTRIERDDQIALSFTDAAAALMSLLVWFLFGAAMIVPAFEHARWADVIFALLALTVVRMVPVAISLAGSGLTRGTIAFVGWFGPRGLASVIFALIAFDDLGSRDGFPVLAAVTMTVLLSVIAHGVSASPFARRYGQHADGLHRRHAEHAPTEALRTRRAARGTGA